MKKLNIDRLDWLSFLNGLVFYAPVALLVRTNAGVTTTQFFILQAVLSLTIFIFEIPTGMLTDKIGYKPTMILAQCILFLSKILLLIAYQRCCLFLFVVEAVAEGIAICFLSGTQDAYVYSMYSKDHYAVKMAHISNFGTAGFIVSTLLYVVLYHFGEIRVLLIATIIANSIGILCVIEIAQEPKLETAHSNKTNIMTVLTNIDMVLLILLNAGFSIAFLLIHFFFVDKLLVCGLHEVWMSPIIISYSIVQMLAEKLLDQMQWIHYRTAMFVSILVSGALMIGFAQSQTAEIVVLIMIMLPLFLSFSEFILNSMENVLIDHYRQENKRATILSTANMVSNLIEIVFLFASAFIAGVGIFACFIGAGIIIMFFGTIIFLRKR